MKLINFLLFFYFSVKIFVATGFPSRHVEIINVLDPDFKCQLTDRNEHSINRWSAVGGLVQNQPVICGGTRNANEELKDVSILGQPNKTFEMFDVRLHSSSIALLNSSKLWITGGISCYGGWNTSERQRKSTELISIDQSPIKGPDLPFVISNHTMVQIDSKTVYIIGGHQNGKVSNKTWIVDPTNDFQIKEGPSLNEARQSHSSARMKIKGKIFIVVAGGNDCGSSIPVPGGHHKKSVELLDTTSPNQVWEMGPDLPARIYSAAMVTSPTEKGVILIGGSASTGSTDYGIWNKLIHLQMTRNSLKSSLKWSYLPQKLQNVRYNHLAFPISTKVFNELKIKL